MTERRIEYRPLDDIPADPRNPKGHRLDTIGESIGVLGYIEPVVIDERTGRLVSGHGRVETLTALRASGGNPPDGVTDDWQIPVVTGWASADDREAARALVALNRTVELGGWLNEPPLFG